jgi:dTDP-4-amino-4,6-dideoxygalactose transaminase
MMLHPARRQPPVHSPLSVSALWRAAAALLSGPDPRLALAERLRTLHGADEVHLTDSGTGALQLAIAAARDAHPSAALVAIPAYSCFDVATAAIGSGATLTCYDLDPATLAPDLASLERCLTLGARIVVVAPLWGVPVDWRALVELVAPWGATLIEDAAQGHGASWAGRPLGALAPLSILSFGRGKGWTGGSGGGFLIGCADRWHRCHFPLPAGGVGEELVGVGVAASQWALARPNWYALPAALPGLHLGETRYHPPRPARPMRRSAAKLLAETAEAAEDEAAHRRHAGRWYQQAIPRGATAAPITIPPDGVAGWLRFPLLLSSTARARADGREARRLGIAPGYPRPLTTLPPVLERLDPQCRAWRWPGAEHLAERLVTLPTHSLLTAEERVKVVVELDRYTSSSLV